MSRWACLFLLGIVGCGQSAPAIVTPPATPQTTAPQRKVIERAALELHVESVAQLRSELTQAVTDLEGYIADSSLYGNRGASHWTIRIPSARLNDFLVRCSGLGTVISQQTSAEDVTDHYIDTEARLTTKRLEEERLQTILKEQTGGLSEVLEVERELSRVRGEIEQMQGRQRFLDQSIAYATVELRAFERDLPRWTSEQPFPQQMAKVLADSWSALLTFLRVMLLIATALLPWAAAALIPGNLVWWFWRRQGGRPRGVS